MRGILGFVVGTTLFAGTASGATPVHLGCEGSMAYSSFAYGDERSSFEDDGRWLPRAALTGTFDLPHRFRMTGLLEYVERGARNTSRGTPFSENQRLLERLVAFGLQWSHPLVAGISLSAGPELTYLLEGHAQGSYSGSSGPPFDYRFDYTDDVERLGILMRFGAEMELPYGAHALVLHGRYVLGITQQGRAGNYTDIRTLPGTRLGSF